MKWRGVHYLSKHLCFDYRMESSIMGGSRLARTHNSYPFTVLRRVSPGGKGERGGKARGAGYKVSLSGAGGTHVKVSEEVEL